MANMLWAQFESTQMSVLFSSNPTNEEWNRMIDDYLTRASTIHSALIYTEGGSPSAFQRKQMRERLPPVKRSALVTSSVIARTAMVAVNLFFPGYRAFAPSDLDGAFDYLEIHPDKRPIMRQKLEDLKRQLRTSQFQ